MRKPETVGSCLDLARKQLPFEDAFALTTYALSKSRAEIIGMPDASVRDSVVKQHRTFVERRQNGEPVAYICGHRHFWTFKLAVNPAVLIPRPETELLVETILSKIDYGDRVLDLATGSGAVAIALASEKNIQVTASDCSSEALKVCEENAERLGVKLKMINSDWYRSVDGKFNAIVCNPPYVADRDPHLSQGDLRFEPRLALVGGTTGLEALEIVVHEAPAHLERDGWLAVEHGYDQRAAVVELFRSAGFTNVSCHEDLSHQPRVVMGRLT